MLKITEDQSDDVTLLRLEGRLTRPFVQELERVCARRAPERLRLDLAGLVFLDADGSAALERLRATRVTLSGASGLVRQLLHAPRASFRPVRAEDSEAELVRRLRAGDARAPELFVRTHGAGLLATASRLLGPGEAAARAVQSAFRAALADLDGLTGAEPLAPWLRRHVLRAALAELRARPIEGEPPAGALEALLPSFDGRGCWPAPRPAAPTWTGTDAVDGATATRVRAALARLPREARLAVLLCDVERLATAEAAALLELTPAALKARLHRARMALCELLAGAPEPARAAAAG